MKYFYQCNNELFRISGILTLILFLLETLKDGYVSFFINPVIILVIFFISGVIWLFTPERAFSE
ncbi:MAG: hypothetical protein CO042_00755 [Parcubacteria group bacterium CG_4_9_14_0_2_um_filter_41_8]|nr:MAG: hypothetical protein COW93_01070 [Parcubacteria group bacterium CG22_combo_CG10-13_8_21_14_all_41_9]PJC41001.1 MAG: hypothetical protein CO042_00755 [Parcubacteria group bacterium CG_4_9_14_0_2_um_filter_41_8]